MSHTSGPWMILTGNFVTTSAGPDWPDHVIAEVRNHDDVKLIAAAPDLLDTLKPVLEWLNNLEARIGRNELLNAMPNNYGGREAIRAAIRKAEGD